MIIAILFCLSYFAGCSGHSDNNEFSLEKKEKATRTIQGSIWDVQLSLYWDMNEVIGIVEPYYKGTEPIRQVIVEPNFIKSKWPVGYVPLTLGKYTWQSDEITGTIPKSYDITTRTTSKTKTPLKQMNGDEAENILTKTEVQIRWVTESGEKVEMMK